MSQSIWDGVAAAGSALSSLLPVGLAAGAALWVVRNKDTIVSALGLSALFPSAPKTEAEYRADTASTAIRVGIENPKLRRDTVSVIEAAKKNPVRVSFGADGLPVFHFDEIGLSGGSPSPVETPAFLKIAGAVDASPAQALPVSRVEKVVSADGRTVNLVRYSATPETGADGALYLPYSVETYVDGVQTAVVDQVVRLGLGGATYAMGSASAAILSGNSPAAVAWRQKYGDAPASSGSKVVSIADKSDSIRVSGHSTSGSSSASEVSAAIEKSNPNHNWRH